MDLRKECTAFMVPPASLGSLVLGPRVTENYLDDMIHQTTFFFLSSSFHIDLLLVQTFIIEA